jgi:hypothetical protein
METLHPLRSWRKRNKLTLADLRDRIAPHRISLAYLSGIEKHGRQPSLDVALRLSQATDGEVRVEDFARSQ